MQAAREAVNKFTSSRGHRTDVDEVVAPAVTQEVIKPHRHEETTEALDREVHQHHYHTTVQPVAHQERLPDQHVHNQLPTQHREIRHENDDLTKRNVEAELGKFHNSRTVAETTQSREAAATVAGEHVHHHVHETVVPVIHKQTIQPEVVHTVQPIHETHIAKSEHHGLSALPMKTLDEFKRSGGILEGAKTHSHEEYDGAPRPYNDKLTTTFDKLGFHEGHHNTTGHHGAGAAGVGAGVAGAGLASKAHGHRNTDSGVGGMGRRRGSNSSSSSASSSDYEYAADGQKVKKNRLPGTGRRHRGTDRSGVAGSGIAGSGMGQRDTMGGQYGDKHAQPTGGNTATGQKPGLMDRLNPMKDTDHDGKKGFMD